uniref:Thyroglobulin type-1 domain-containing protein n=1 Tax=Mola mola TaxID=94237 RepID=A0A3Q3W242_MOLML
IERAQTLSPGGYPAIGAYVPQCDADGHYLPLQCHGSTGHCWCVDSRGHERAGTRTPPGAQPKDCDEPGEAVFLLKALGTIFMIFTIFKNDEKGECHLHRRKVR